MLYVTTVVCDANFMADTIRSFRDLRLYQEAFDLQQEIFRRSKKWPSEEKYALTSQIRRSSRSIGANISERGPNAFIPRIL